MLCFIISVECRYLEIPEALEPSLVVLMTVLKSPGTMTFVTSHRKEKMLWRKVIIVHDVNVGSV